MRSEVFDALKCADHDEAVSVMIIHGSGISFSSGRNLGSDITANRPIFTAGRADSWSWHLAEGCFRIRELSKPVIT